MYKVMEDGKVRDATVEEIEEIESRKVGVHAAVPLRVSMRQARLALLAAGKLSRVDAAIDSLPSPQKETARIEWEYAGEVERQSSLVSLMGPALDLDDEDLDALFVDAATY